MKDTISNPENAAIIEKLNSLVRLRLERKSAYRRMDEYRKVLDGEPDNPDDICSPIDVKDYGGDITAFEKRQREKSDWVAEIKECAASYSGEYSEDDDYRNDDEYYDDDECGIRSYYFDYEYDEIAECREKLHEIRHSLPEMPYKKDLIKHKYSIGFVELFSFFFDWGGWLKLLFVLGFLALIGVGAAFINLDAEYFWIGFIFAAPLGLLAAVALVGWIICLISFIKTAFVNKKIDAQNVQLAAENQRQFEVDMRTYNQQVEELYKEYKKQLDKTREAVKECVVRRKQEKAEIQSELDRIMDTINGSEYDFYGIRDYSTERLRKIAGLLSSGRADSYKEALNMCIAQEEQEARDEEERLWREEQAEEERRRERAREEQRRQDIQREQDRERRERWERERAERRRAEEERQERVRAEYKAKNRCANCKHLGKCRQYGTVNCASYVPR